MTTYWEAWPARRPHDAVLVPAAPVATAAGDKLKFTLRFGASRHHNLGHFRLSVSADPATLEQEEKRFAILKVTDPWLKLAAAYAVNGHNDEASQYFGRALQRADGYEARKPIVELAARFDDVLSALVQRQPDDSQLQLALAQVAYDQKKFAFAVRFFAEALANDPKLGDDRQTQHRYNAACAAARAAAGEGQRGAAAR